MFPGTAFPPQRWNRRWSGTRTWAEAAVVGATDEHTGQAIIAWVILESHTRDHGKDMVDELSGGSSAGDFADSPPEGDPRRPGVTEDPQRQDHAPATA